MIDILVELAGANPALGAAELAGALEALGGRLVVGPHEPSRLVRAEVTDRASAELLGRRLALSRRVILPIRADRPWEVAGSLGPSAPSASFRPLDSPSGGPLPAEVEGWIGRWKRAGGRIDLEQAERRFLYRIGPDGAELFGEELLRIDGRAMRARRMPQLPFRRPVSLPPQLGRALVNLAAVRAGERVVDPFVGTGALLIESALLGARVVGIDRDPAMVRGALRNLAHCDCVAEALLVADAAAAAQRFPAGRFDALVTDPPYGRASGSDREPPTSLVERTLAAWTDRLAPGGRIAIAGPGGPDLAPPGWLRTLDVADRVHRSLTRRFRLYRRAPGPSASPVAASSP